MQVTAPFDSIRVHPLTLLKCIRRLLFSAQMDLNDPQCGARLEEDVIALNERKPPVWIAVVQRPSKKCVCALLEWIRLAAASAASDESQAEETVALVSPAIVQTKLEATGDVISHQLANVPQLVVEAPRRCRASRCLPSGLRCD